MSEVTVREHTVREHERSAPKRPRGRQTFVPTPEERKQVEAMSGYGIKHEEIAHLVRMTEGGIDEKTLRKHFHLELQQGKAMAHARVGQTLYSRAVTGENPALLMFYCKTQMGMREVERHEITGADGAPLPMAPSLTIIQEVLPGRTIEADPAYPVLDVKP